MQLSSHIYHKLSKQHKTGSLFTTSEPVLLENKCMVLSATHLTLIEYLHRSTSGKLTISEVRELNNQLENE